MEVSEQMKERDQKRKWKTVIQNEIFQDKYKDTKLKKCIKNTSEEYELMSKKCSNYGDAFQYPVKKSPFSGV